MSRVFLKSRSFIYLAITLFFNQCTPSQEDVVFESKNLKLVQLTATTFVHISYLQTQDYGLVACNGLVYISDDEAAVIDTPLDSIATSELLDWIEVKKSATVKFVVPSHFHADCLATLAQFHEQNIPSFGHDMTIERMDTTKYAKPLVAFDNSLTLPLGQSTVQLKYFGPGHTEDNIVAYVPTEKVLFGGCLLKELNAGKGYLGDAKVDQWSPTVQTIKSAYPQVEIVIPGHGQSGSTELLDYTIALFETIE